MNKGRFKSQALLNEQALLSCMVYVDLNPIRATLADNLDESDFTSIQQRIRDNGVRDNGELLCLNGELEKQEQDREKKHKQMQKLPKLADFVGGKQVNGIPYRLMDYFELVDWTGRTIRDYKRGYIPDKEPKIISKLGIDTEIWLDTVKEYSQSYHSFVGSEKQLKKVCESTGKKWLAGIKSSRVLYC